MDDLIPEVEGLKAIDFMQDAKEFIDDEDFSNALDLAMVLIVDPSRASERTSQLIVKLEAYALKFRIGFAAHMGIAKIKDNHKKNMYKELYQGLDNLADALKYIARNGDGW